MSTLWRRSVSLTVGPAGGEGSRVGTAPDGSQGLDIDFVVEMTDAPEPNKARIVVWNPPAGLVTQARDADAVVRLTVGHLGDDGDGLVRQVFVGNPVRGGVRFDRATGSGDRTLEIEARDGGHRYSMGRISTSFATLSTARQVFSAISQALDLPLGQVDLDDAQDYPAPLALVGPARVVLDDLVAGMDRVWFIRDGALHVVQRSQDTGEQAIVFSAAAGNLIGSPMPTDKGVEVRALLAPTLRPRKLFQLASADFAGLYRCTDVRFQGSSYGGPFEVVAKGVPKR